MIGGDAVDLADWRERVARMYLADTDIATFRATRDELFATHPQSPVPPERRDSFTGLSYFPETDAGRATVPMRPADGEISIDSGGPDGVLTYARVGLLDTPWGELTLFWLAAYGGGLFLPFRDGTASRDYDGPRSYGAGRYLTDTVKGTFGRGLVFETPDRVRLDINYAYNPSCAYDDRWACPLAPPENRLDVPIPAGELAHHGDG
ncbi:MAG TPA: DUF1684 domain-containing protein [Micromonosporaceae bacterium]|nr:DUF1684 domain-containing protein [Micromonosporaceae bacterium]